MPLKILICDNNNEISELIKDDNLINSTETCTNINKIHNSLDNRYYDICILNPELHKNDLEETVTKFIDKKIPILMLLDKPSGIELIIDGLSFGAFDYFHKIPLSIMDESQAKANAQNIIEKIIFAIDAKDKIHRPNIILDDKLSYDFSSSTKKLIIIGSSTGGPQSLEQVIPLIPKEIPSSVIVVQHMPEEFTNKFAQRLDKISNLHVKEAEQGEELKEGVCYIAKGNYHLELIKQNNKIILNLNKKERVHGIRPSVDITMQSATKYFGKNIIGVIMTGMGSDGTIGSKKIKESGGTVIVQSEKTSIIFGMPKSVIMKGFYDEIVDLDKIPVAILQILEV